MSELSLEQLQLAFMAELSGKPSKAFRALVKDNVIDGKMSRNRRVDIYVANHVGARANALGQVYEVCQQILGESVFEMLANEYVGIFGSTHWDLNFHGKDFDQYLEQQVSEVADLKDLFYLGELARFEWAFHVCYFADANPTYEAIDQDPDKLKFAIDTSVQLLNNQWPIYQIWHNNRNDKGTEPVKNDQDAYYHLIHRTKLTPQIYPLTQVQHNIMVDCIAGKTLSELTELHGEAVSQNIPLFIQHQWIFLSH